MRLRGNTLDLLFIQGWQILLTLACQYTAFALCISAIVLSEVLAAYMCALTLISHTDECPENIMAQVDNGIIDLIVESLRVSHNTVALGVNLVIRCTKRCTS